MKILIKITYLIILILLIGLFRQLTWNNNSFNIDELEWVYLLERIKYNPLPFSGFTAHTSGPLSIYFLSIINLFIENPTLKSLRIFQFIVCIIPSLIIAHNSISKKGQWLGTFIFFLFFITSDYPITFDFLAYNTEYQLLLITSIIYYLQKDLNPHILKIFLTSFLTISLFLIKTQAIIFVGYFTIIYLLQLLLIHRKRAYILIISTLFTFLIYLFILKHFEILNDFYYEYLYKNFLYAKLAKGRFISHVISYGHFITKSLYFYWIVLFVILRLTFWPNVKNSISNLMNIDLIKSILFLLVSLLTLYISSNNFQHYLVLLFLPMSLLIGELANVLNIKSIRTKIQSILILSIAFFLFYYPVNIEIVRKIKDQKLDDYKLNLGFNYLDHQALDYEKNLYYSIDRIEKQNVINFIKNQVPQNSKSVNKIYIFGWGTSQGFYYAILKLNRLISNSSHNYYLMFFHKNKDWINYKKEETKLLIVIKDEKPLWIIDAEKLLIPLKKFPINKFISTNYQIALKTENITVYRLKEN